MFCNLSSIKNNHCGPLRWIFLIKKSHVKLEFTKLEFLVNIQHIHLQIVPFIFPSPKIMTFSLGGRRALVCAKMGRVKPAKKSQHNGVGNFLSCNGSMNFRLNGSCDREVLALPYSYSWFALTCSVRASKRDYLVLIIRSSSESVDLSTNNTKPRISDNEKHFHNKPCNSKTSNSIHLIRLAVSTCTSIEIHGT